MEENFATDYLTDTASKIARNINRLLHKNMVK